MLHMVRWKQSGIQAVINAESTFAHGIGGHLSITRLISYAKDPTPLSSVKSCVPPKEVHRRIQWLYLRSRRDLGQWGSEPGSGGGIVGESSRNSGSSNKANIACDICRKTAL